MIIIEIIKNIFFKQNNINYLNKINIYFIIFIKKINDYIII